MVERNEETISSAEELNEIFSHDESKMRIADKFETPKIGGKAKVITILHSKSDDGTLGVVKKVINDKFTGGSGIFMTVSEYNHPEVELQMGLSKSLFNSIDRMCNSEKIQLVDLPGKIVQITANEYDKYKCNKCGGRGCPDCGNTGNSTVFNVSLRHDLMNPTTQIKGTTDEF